MHRSLRFGSTVLLGVVAFAMGDVAHGVVPMQRLAVPQSLVEFEVECGSEVFRPRRTDVVHFCFDPPVALPGFVPGRRGGLRQEATGDEAGTTRLVVSKVALAGGVARDELDVLSDPDVAKALESGPWTWADGDVRRVAAEMSTERTDTLEIVRALVQGLRAQIRPAMPYDACRRASEVLRSEIGSPFELALTLTALCRAQGIPARPALGLLWVEGELIPHAWVEAWVGQWWAVDAMLASVHADATRITAMVEPTWNVQTFRRFEQFTASLKSSRIRVELYASGDTESRPHDLSERLFEEREGRLVSEVLGLSMALPAGGQWSEEERREGERRRHLLEFGGTGERKGGVRIWTESVPPWLVSDPVADFQDLGPPWSRGKTVEEFAGRQVLCTHHSPVPRGRQERALTWTENGVRWGFGVVWHDPEERAEQDAWLASVEIEGAAAHPEDPEPEFGAWRDLFDGRTLDGWAETDFGGGAELVVEDGRMKLGFGEPLTGVHWTREFPTEDYELEIAAARMGGTDFFIGLTFPVGEEHLTLIVGGWGGSLVGISSLDGEDASENETRQYHGFQPGQEYRVRLRVQRERLQLWLEGERIIDVDLKGRELSLRAEVELSKPMGLCTFTTLSAVRVVRLREFAR